MFATRIVALIAGGSLCALGARAASAQQEMPNPQQLQMQIQRIAQERPPQAEGFAREFLQQIVPGHAPSLDSLKAAAPDPYWMEIGQLMVQREMVQNLSRRDTVRGKLMAQVFGTEAQARSLQRAYRGSSESQRQGLRAQLESIITRHFEIEDQLRALEVADIERRLAEVRAESDRNRQKRAELVKWAVDGIIRDVMKPE